MTDDTWFSSAKGLDKDEIAVDYIKAQDFRVIWADGAIGGITPNGLIHFACYSERHPIPRRQVYKIEPVDGIRGTLGKEVIEKQLSRGAVVREMACDIFLTRESAKNLSDWLLGQIENMKKIESNKS